MLYSNIGLWAYNKGSYFLPFGRQCANKILPSIRCGRGIELRCGKNVSYSISFEDDEPVIIPEFSHEISIMLSAEGNFPSKVPGRIQVLLESLPFMKYKQYTGFYKNTLWPCGIFLIKDITTIIQVQKTGCSDAELYLVSHLKSDVFCFSSIDDLKDSCEKLKIGVPCNIIASNDGTLHFNEKEWIDF